MTHRVRKLWRRYGYCAKCKAHAQEPCKSFMSLLPCKDRESYQRFCERWSLILSEHYGYPILPQEVHNYQTGERRHGNEST